jgi:hypothetical protein
MDVVGWIWFGLTRLLGVIWSVLWFLLGGWVVTLVQLVVIVGLVFGYKYGWSRAPVELAQRGRRIGGFLWAWARARELPAQATVDRVDPTTARVRRGNRRQAGDVNVSTLLSILALIGLAWVAAV